MAVTPVQIFEVEGEQEINMVDGYSNVEKSQTKTTMPPQFPRLTFRPELDGLRTLAVVPVVLYHFNVSFPGGFAGVDVFFVISGYLITSVLLSSLESERFQFRDFWLRRCRRLFPASAVMLLVMLCVANFALLGEDYEKMSHQATATLLFGANFHIYFTTDSYFNNPLEVPLLHCWSLAVEEQFYFLFPGLLSLMWWCCAVQGRQRVIIEIVLAVVGLASFIASVLVATPSSGDIMFGFYLLPCRSWEMLLGSGLVFVESRLRELRQEGGPDSRRMTCAREVAGWSGLIMIVVSYFVLHHKMPWPSYPTLLPCLGTILFIASNTSYTYGKIKTKTTHARLLGLSPLVAVGGASYSIYLWHWPIFVFMSYASIKGQLDSMTTALGISLSFIVGFVSWLTVERLFRRRRHRSSMDAKKDATSTIKPTRPIPTMTSDRPFLLLVFIAWLSLLLFTTLGANVFGNRYKVAPVTKRNYTNSTMMEGADDPSGERTRTLVTTITNTNGSNTTMASTVLCVERRTRQEADELWRVRSEDIVTGNILASKSFQIHNWRNSYYSGLSYGGPVDQPVTMAFIGTSHLQQVTPLLLRLADRFQVRIALISFGGDYGRFFSSSDSTNRGSRAEGLNKFPSSELTWDQARLKYLEEWNGGVSPDGTLKLVVRIGFWGGDWGPPRQPAWWYPNHRASPPDAGGRYDFSYEMKVLSDRANRVLYLGDNPSMQNAPASGSFKKWCYQKFKQDGESWKFLETLQEKETFRARRLNAERDIRDAAGRSDESWTGRVFFEEIADLFEVEVEGGGHYLQLVDPDSGSLVVGDFSHINADGELRLERRFRETIFGQPVC